MLKKLKKNTARVLAVLGILGGGFWAKTRLDPMPKGPKTYVKIEKAESINDTLDRLYKAGIIRDPFVPKVVAIFRSPKKTISPGTYQFNAGMGIGTVFKTLQEPMNQMVRIPEGRWASRVGKLLESKDVAPAKDYIDLVKAGANVDTVLGMPLEGKSLEGFLYPDTYDLPPLTGAKPVILKQIQNFESKMKAAKLAPKDLYQTVTLASLLELEASDPNDRRMISGVIQNRIKKKMRLQIDATVNYGLQKWRRLTYADYRNTDSPYNTYRVNGLPPGPICSPSINSIEAAMNPAKHNYLYYVALIDGRTIYAANYTDHLKNVKRRRDEIKAAQAKAKP